MEFNAISLSRFIMRRAIDTINDSVHSENRCNIEVKRSTFLKCKGRRERENILCANNLSIYLIYATEIIRNSRMLFSEWLSTNIRLVQGNSQFTYDNLVVPNHFPSVICWWCSMHIWEGQYVHGPYGKHLSSPSVHHVVSWPAGARRLCLGNEPHWCAYVMTGSTICL